MTDQTLQTLAWMVVLVVAVQAWATYAIVHLFVMQRSIFQRREREDDDARIRLVSR